MSNVYRFRDGHMPTDIVQCLGILHTQALRGTATGIAFVAMIEGYGYIADTSGKACDDPTYTRGMLCALDDKLSVQMRSRAL